MQVTRLVDAKPYETKNHHGVCSLRMQGWDTSQTKAFWTGLSYFLPQGGATFEASSVERIYVVLEGEITIITDAGEVTLGRLDSCHIPANERRGVENRGSSVASMLVIGQYPQGITR